MVCNLHQVCGSQLGLQLASCLRFAACFKSVHNLHQTWFFQAGASDPAVCLGHCDANAFWYRLEDRIANCNRSAADVLQVAPFWLYTPQSSQYGDLQADFFTQNGHDDDDDHLSELLPDKSTDNADNANETPEETLISLGALLDDSEQTCDDIKPQLASIVEKRWNKKLTTEKIKSITDKYNRPANCTTLHPLTVNPEIWSKLPFYQQRADLNSSNIQEAVRKTAMISIQTAHALSNASTNELHTKELLTQQVDAIALLGHISHEIASLRRYKIKSVLKPEYAAICADHGQDSKFLFGDDLPKRLKDAKETSSVSQVIKSNKARSSSHNTHQSRNNDRRNWRQGSNYNPNTGLDFYRGGKPHHFRKKGVKPQSQQKK